jgi:glycosyltransferase involved in cell wall biosynthesis
MRVLFVLPYALGRVPGQRYRVEQWAPYLRDVGVECDLFPLLSPEDQDTIHAHALPYRKAGALAASFARGLRAAVRSRRYDVVWLHRTALLAGPPLSEWILSRAGPPLVYEFDDAIWLTKNLDANRAWGFLKCSWKTAPVCRMADHVVVGSEHLAEFARRHNPKVTIVPSTVDVDQYPTREHNGGPGPVVIGWSGSPTTVEDLRHVEGALRRVAAEADVAFRFMGGEASVPGVSASYHPWSAETEVDELRSYDVGIMPLPDDPWRRGKCGMKALLYMAVGVPTVASPVGLNTEIVRDGENGLLASTEDEWVESLVRLARDAALRRRLGEAGRATVESQFSPRAQVPRVLDVLNRAAEGRAGAPGGATESSPVCAGR